MNISMWLHKWYNKLIRLNKYCLDKKYLIYAPISGEIIILENTHNPIFAEKLIGDGIAIKPTSEFLVAPVSGVISQINNTFNAFSIISFENLEIFVHFDITGIAKLSDCYFKLAVREGKTVIKGETVISCDIAALKNLQKSMLVYVVIINMDAVKLLIKYSGKIISAQSSIMCVTQ